MLYTDIVPLTYATKAATYNTVIRPSANGYPGTGTISGALSSVYDGSTATYYQYYLFHGGDGNTCGEFYVDTTWVKPCTIYSTYAYATDYFHCGNYPTGQRKRITYLRIGGVWTLIANYDLSFNWTTVPDQFNSWYIYEATTTGPWNDVTGIRFYMYGYCYSYEGWRNQEIYLRIGEVKAYRQKNQEVLRIKTPSAVVSIGGNDVTTAYKLRTNKNGTIWGIPLLDTDDPTASTVRVYNGSAVKSLVQADS